MAKCFPGNFYIKTYKDKWQRQLLQKYKSHSTSLSTVSWWGKIQNCATGFHIVIECNAVMFIALCRGVEWGAEGEVTTSSSTHTHVNTCTHPHTALQSGGQVWHKQDNIYRMVAWKCGSAINYNNGSDVYRTVSRMAALFQQTTLALMQQPEPQLENIPTLSIQCRDRERGGGRGRAGGTNWQIYASAGKATDMTGWFRNVRHVCINTSPLLSSHLFPSTSFSTLFALFIPLFLFYLFVNSSSVTACRINQRWWNNKISNRCTNG